MVNITPTLVRGLKGAQKVFNAIGPYAVGNVAAAAALHSGVDTLDHIYDMPAWLQNLQLYGGLAAFNAGVLVPAVRNGPMNYVRSLFHKDEDDGFTLRPHAKTFLLCSALALGLGNHGLRDSSFSALEKMADDVSSLVHSKKGEEPQPPQPPQPGYPDLGDPLLEGKITDYVNGLRAKGLARARGIEDYSIYAKDLHSGEVIVDINTHEQRLAASTNKVYILLAAETLVDQGKLEYTQQLERNLVGMIRSSNNASTDWIIDQIGKEALHGRKMSSEEEEDFSEGVVNGIIQEYGFEDTVIEEINQAQTGGRTLGNKTSVEDIAEFLERLYHREFPRSDDMIRIMTLDGGSGHPDRIVDGTCIYRDPKFLVSNGGYIESVTDKTGYLWGANNNAGIVDAHFYNKRRDTTTDVPYIFAFMIEDEDAKPDKFRGSDKAWGHAKSETGRSISESVFWNLQPRYSDISIHCIDDKTHRGVHPQ